MTRFVALLRGINVGNKQVPMAELRALFQGLGHRDVRTYIQSGNVAFDAAATGSRDADAVGAAAKAEIARVFGHDVHVLVRTPDELAAVVEASPYETAGAEPAALHVTFLATEPDPERVAALTVPAGETGVLAVVGREVHLHVPDGYGRTKLSNAFLERALAVPATTRNWRSVRKLRDMAATPPADA